MKYMVVESGEASYEIMFQPNMTHSREFTDFILTKMDLPFVTVDEHKYQIKQHSGDTVRVHVGSTLPSPIIIRAIMRDFGTWLYAQRDKYVEFLQFLNFAKEHGTKETP
jgi:hypothetical protein